MRYLMPLPKPRSWIVGLLLTVLIVRAAFAASADEYQVKAAFLYNFAKFVEWPATTFKTEKDPIRICVLGADPFGDALAEVLHGKTVLSHPLTLAGISDPAQSAECQIVFVSSSEQKRLRSVLRALPPAGTLTIGESDGFTEQGGMVNFTRENGH